jgi:hypothetical protein
MDLVTAYLAYELIAQRHDADRKRMHSIHRNVGASGAGDRTSRGADRRTRAADARAREVQWMVRF